VSESIKGMALQNAAGDSPISIAYRTLDTTP
jgi:hypothetical protein